MAARHEIISKNRFVVYARENPEYQSGGLKTFEGDLFDGTVTDFKGGIITKYKRLMLRNGGNDWIRNLSRMQFYPGYMCSSCFEYTGLSSVCCIY